MNYTGQNMSCEVLTFHGVVEKNNQHILKSILLIVVQLLHLRILKTFFRLAIP